MGNPFDGPDGTFLVLRNEEHQYSLWPVAIPVPGGWSVSHGPATQAGCLDYVEENWLDMRPRSLVERMERSAADGS